jgi:hypothetical protein
MLGSRPSAKPLAQFYPLLLLHPLNMKRNPNISISEMAALDEYHTGYYSIHHLRILEVRLGDIG